MLINFSSVKNLQGYSDNFTSDLIVLNLNISLCVKVFLTREYLVFVVFLMEQFYSFKYYVVMMYN